MAFLARNGQQRHAIVFHWLAHFGAAMVVQEIAQRHIARLHRVQQRTVVVGVLTMNVKPAVVVKFIVPPFNDGQVSFRTGV